MRVTPWETEKDETKRTLKYIMPVSNPIGKYMGCYDLISFAHQVDYSSYEGSRSGGNASAIEKGRLPVSYSMDGLDHVQ